MYRIGDRPVQSFFKSFYASRDGNFAFTTALVLPALLMAAGLAVDLLEMSRVRGNLQEAVDSAALAAASAMAAKGAPEQDAKALAASFIAGHMGITADDKNNLESPAVDVGQKALSNNAKSYTVKVTANYTVKLSGLQVLLGRSTAVVSASGTAESSTESKNPISMYLALDRSGSMQWVTSTIDTTQTACNNYYEANWPKATYQSPCYVKKIDSLKMAVSALATEFAKLDPNHELIRTGAVSYSSSANTPSPLAWGTTTTTTYVNALTASGSTNSTPALQIAYNALTATTENAAHMAKTGLVPAKYIVFMTDCANDSASIDTSTKALCDTAKKNGIQIYTVAFSAPANGKALLAYCASGSSYAFEAENVVQLVAAFQSIAAKTSKLSNRLTQ